MANKQTKRRNLGIFTGIMFLACFFTLPLIGGCDGSEILQANMEARGSDSTFIVLLLIAALLCVTVGTFLFWKQRFRGAGAAGLLSIAGSVLALFIAKAGLSDFNPGAWICLLLLGVFTLSAVVPDEAIVWVPEIGEVGRAERDGK